MLVKETYVLEGDGALALSCYEVVATLSAGIHVQHYPNLFAIAQTILNVHPAHRQQWIDFGKVCIGPGLQYFNQTFSASGEIGESLKLLGFYGLRRWLKCYRLPRIYCKYFHF